VVLSEELSILEICRLRQKSSEKVSRHPGGNLSQSGLQVADT